MRDGRGAGTDVSRGDGPAPPTAARRRREPILPRIAWLDRAHGWVYTHWIYVYVALAMRARPVVQWALVVVGAVARGVARLRRETVETESDLMAESVHGKVMTVDHAVQLVQVDQEIDITACEKVIPFRQARDIVLHNPTQVVAVDCACRVARGDGACQPLDVCLVIGDPFAERFVTCHPEHARRIEQTEAVAILRAEHERGHVHHAFFKDAMLGRMYAICNCCSCCCGPMEYFHHGTPMLVSSGYVTSVAPQLCKGCSICIDICPFGAMSIEFGIVTVDEQRCMGCGVCTSQCAHGALALRRDPSRGEPLAIRELLEHARC